MVLSVALCALASGSRAQTANTCLDCHGALDPPLQVTEAQSAQDIHAQKGLTCASCHGGDPTKADMDAMSKAAGFRGKIERSQIPALCGRCHSDATSMKQYNPGLRTDQFSQYETSVHGKLLAKGDTKVAVCIDCHGVHDLRPPSDPRSKVYPVNVARDLCTVPCRCRLHEAVRHSHEPICRVPDERASCRDDGARGSERSDLHDLSWQPRRGPAGGRFSQECLC